MSRILSLILLLGLSGCIASDYYLDNRGNRVYTMGRGNPFMLIDTYVGLKMELIEPPDSSAQRDSLKTDSLATPWKPDPKTSAMHLRITLTNTAYGTTINVLFHPQLFMVTGKGPDLQIISHPWMWGAHNRNFDWKKDIVRLKPGESVSTVFVFESAMQSSKKRQYWSSGSYYLTAQYRNIVPRVNDKYLVVGDIASEEIVIVIP